MEESRVCLQKYWLTVKRNGNVIYISGVKYTGKKRNTGNKVTAMLYNSKYLGNFLNLNKIIFFFFGFFFCIFYRVQYAIDECFKTASLLTKKRQSPWQKSRTSCKRQIKCDKTNLISFVYYIKNHKLHKQITKQGIIQCKVLT